MKKLKHAAPPSTGRQVAPIVLRRFDPFVECAGKPARKAYGEMEEHPIGDFVKYEDVVELLGGENRKPLAFFLEHPKTLDSYVFQEERDAIDKAEQWEADYELDEGQRVEITPLYPAWKESFVTDAD